MNAIYLLMVMLSLLSICSAVSAEVTQKVMDDQRDFNAVQKVYLHGVPHTDSQGNVRTSYDPKTSFFQIGLWGVPMPREYMGVRYDWAELKQAGFNTVWPWMVKNAPAELDAGKKYGMQIVLMEKQKEEILQKIKGHPNLLGNVWMDEPIGKFGSIDMDKLFQDFQAYRQKVHQIIPNLPVFINDAPWITAPATSWWMKWNTSGEISCHDNYPIIRRGHNVRSIGLNPNGIPQTVSLAVAGNKEQKPVWLIVGAFEQAYKVDDPFPFRYPTPEQLRSQVYAGLIHGATGIIFFTWDSYVSRNGLELGMSANPQATYPLNSEEKTKMRSFTATPIQLVKARALWETTVQINRELAELTPAILSPTESELGYKVHVTGTAVTEAPIRTLLKKNPDGGYVLLTVNMDDAVLDATCTFSKPLSSVQVLFENHQKSLSSPASSDHFTLHYEPFDAHVVQIRLEQ